jgi:predicted lipid-binding transport protein (Tim44 family)
MKKAALFLTVAFTSQLVFAGGFPRESYNGALLGTVVGGLWGGHCHDHWSGRGAAIGAGVGLALGTLAGEARRAEERRFCQATIDYASAPPISTSVHQQPAAPRSGWTAQAAPNRIPDAPRVPDAPTF